MHVVRDREFFLVSFLLSCDASEKAIEKILVASDMNFSLCVCVCVCFCLSSCALCLSHLCEFSTCNTKLNN